MLARSSSEAGGLDALALPGPDRPVAEESLPPRFRAAPPALADPLRQVRRAAAAGDRHLAEFVPWVLTEESDWGGAYNVELTTIERREEHQVGYIADVDAWLAGTKQLQTWQSGELPGPVIDSLVTGTPRELPVNIPNTGQVPDVPDDAVVESICIVDDKGVRGRDVARLPRPYAELLRRHVSVAEMTVAAAIEADRALAADRAPRPARRTWRPRRDRGDDRGAAVGDRGLAPRLGPVSAQSSARGRAPETRRTTMEIGFVGLGAMGLPMTRHLVEAGHRVTVASRSPGPVKRAVDFGAHDGGSPLAVARGRRRRRALCAELAAGRRGGRGDAARGRAGHRRGRLLDDRPRRRARPARAGHRDGSRVPRRPPLRWDRGGRGGHPHRDGGWRRPDPRDRAPGPRGVRRPHRPRRWRGDGASGQALQQSDLRGADAGNRRGDRPRGQVRRRPGQVPRGARALDGDVSRRDPAPGRGRGAGESRVERLAARLHDRAHGEGPRSGARLRRRGRRPARLDRDRPPGAHRRHRRRTRPGRLLGARNGRLPARRSRGGDRAPKAPPSASPRSCSRPITEAAG